MNTLALLLALVSQAPTTSALDSPLSDLRSTLQQLRTDFEPDDRVVRGATPALTTAKHGLRDWVESRLAGQGEGVTPIVFGLSLHDGLTDAGLLCQDFQIECGSNFLGYVDDVRVSRQGPFLSIVTSMGIWCGYDESAYLYAWDGRQWLRMWEFEQLTYTEAAYRPQFIHDVLVSEPNPAAARTLLLLGSQASCTGAFKDLYARAWQLNPGGDSDAVLDWTEFANDGYPPIQGRVHPDDVLFQFQAAGLAAGDPHTAVRHFRVEDDAAVQVEPIAGRPHDFVVEWLATPWEQSRAWSESMTLEAAHTELYNEDGFGDTPDATLGCTDGDDLWQVATAVFRGPQRYYRVRWTEPYRFTLIEISEAPYLDCTVEDERGDAYPDLLGAVDVN
jgi:hypothetical protein